MSATYDITKPRVAIESPVDELGSTRTMEIGNSSHLTGESEFFRSVCGYAVHLAIFDNAKQIYVDAGSFYPN